MKWLKRIIFIIIFIVFITSVCKAVDLSGCTDALDRIRRAASNASDAANEAENKKQELEEAEDKLEEAEAEDELEKVRNELQDCLTFPDIYDLLDDGCQSYCWDYRSAKSDYDYAYSDYESAKSNYKYTINNLVSELDSLAFKIRSMEYSCEYELIRVVEKKDKKQQQGTVKQANPASVFTAKDSNVYHKRDCSSLDSTKGLVEFTSSQQAQNAGGLPCNYCNP